MNISGIAPVIKKGLNVVGALFAGGRVDGNDVESDPHAANNDQCELNGGRNRSSSTEIPSCDEEEDEKKKNSSRIDAAEVAAPADTIAAASTKTPSKSRTVPTTVAVKTGMKVDASGHTMNQKVERDSTEVDVVQPPPKRQTLSKQSQEASFPCRNFPASKESEHSSEIDSPVESTIASSSEEMKDSVQGNSSQMDEESTPDKSTTNSIPESVKGSDAEPVDIAYQNMKSQTQCRATKEGRIWRPKGKWGRCQNCVEGVFQYCYAHRNLDMDQDRYWAQRYNKKYVSVLA
mmetsp:Transcript_20376/g.23496  ORF Transcript_20376/g.23496 Transcript_20376/m.23496 type:complete len:290 (+) Transcript_20376:126-995(+)